jgi:hypothetical protein
LLPVKFNINILNAVINILNALVKFNINILNAVITRFYRFSFIQLFRVTDSDSDTVLVRVMSTVLQLLVCQIIFLSGFSCLDFVVWMGSLVWTSYNRFAQLIFRFLTIISISRN